MIGEGMVVYHQGTWSSGAYLLLTYDTVVRVGSEVCPRELVALRNWYSPLPRGSRKKTTKGKSEEKKNFITRSYRSGLSKINCAPDLRLYSCAL